MANQLGCVLVFKRGVDPDEVIARLKTLEDLVDTEYHISNGDNVVETADGRGAITRLNAFNPAWGSGPVWYVP